MKKVLLYLLSSILFIGYIVILVLSMKPNVSWEYELYYITKEIDIWPGLHGFNYELGTKIETVLENEDNCKRFEKGWGPFERNGLWSDGLESKIYFNNLPNKNLIFEMTLVNLDIDKWIDIYLNDIKVSRIQKSELKSSMKINQQIKLQDIKNGKLIITLKYDSDEENSSGRIMCREIILYEEQ